MGREFVLSFEGCWRQVQDQPQKLRLEVVTTSKTPPIPTVANGGVREQSAPSMFAGSPPTLTSPPSNFAVSGRKNTPQMVAKTVGFRKRSTARLSDSHVSGGSVDSG